MARTRTQRTAEPQLLTVNAMDRIVDRLNTISGIEFTKDAWVNKAPENYGVVELSGEARQLWADGHMTDSAWNVIVNAYVKDDRAGFLEIPSKANSLRADSSTSSFNPS